MATRRYTLQLRQHIDKLNGMSSGKANDKQHEMLSKCGVRAQVASNGKRHHPTSVLMPLTLLLEPFLPTLTHAAAAPNLSTLTLHPAVPELPRS